MTYRMHTGSPEGVIDRDMLRAHLDQYIDTRIVASNVKRLLVIPPDITRLGSQAGEITGYLWDRLAARVHIDILPALGTHTPMSQKQCEKMFGAQVPFDRIHPHRWRNDLTVLGEIPAQTLSDLSNGKFAQPVQVALNKMLFEGNYDLILSIGQVVPHEVVGMANYTKNIMIGVGGKDTIDKSHFLGAACGMESIMGRADTPVRRLLNHAYDVFVREQLPIDFALTVVGPSEKGLALRGLFMGDGDDTFEAAAELSQKVNVTLVDQPIDRCVVMLDPDKFHSTWLGAKALYRTRMAMADGGELIVLAPGLDCFGEDEKIDALIRKHGYCGTPPLLKALEADPELSANLSAAAHLIHGSTEGRFDVTYCTTHKLSRQAVESVGLKHRDYHDAVTQYAPGPQTACWRTDATGQRYFYIPNPALGLWACADNPSPF